MQTLKRLPTWQKVLGAAAVIGGGWWLYNSQKKKTVKPKTTEPVEPESEPEPQEPTSPPTPPAGLGGTFPGQLGLQNTIKRRTYNQSDNQNMPAPVNVRMLDNRDGTYTVIFRYQGGSERFRHHTREAAELRFESMVQQPSEWTCSDISYDSVFDGWICKAGFQAGDMVARGFHDTERGPAPWFVTWDGAKYVAQFMADLRSDPETLGTFDDLFQAVQEASGA